MFLGLGLDSFLDKTQYKDKELTDPELFLKNYCKEKKPIAILSKDILPKKASSLSIFISF